MALVNPWNPRLDWQHSVTARLWDKQCHCLELRYDTVDSLLKGECGCIVNARNLVWTGSTRSLLDSGTSNAIVSLSKGTIWSYELCLEVNQVVARVGYKLSCTALLWNLSDQKRYVPIRTERPKQQRIHYYTITSSRTGLTISGNNMTSVGFGTTAMTPQHQTPKLATLLEPHHLTHVYYPCPKLLDKERESLYLKTPHAVAQRYEPLPLIGDSAVEAHTVLIHEGYQTSFYSAVLTKDTGRKGLPGHRLNASFAQLLMDMSQVNSAVGETGLRVITYCDEAADQQDTSGGDPIAKIRIIR